MKGRGRRGSNANLTLFSFRGALRGFNRPLDSWENIACGLKQRAPCISQFHSTRLATKQLHAQLAFQRLDLPAERRLLHSEALGGS